MFFFIQGLEAQPNIQNTQDASIRPIIRLCLKTITAIRAQVDEEQRPHWEETPAAQRQGGSVEGWREKGQRKVPSPDKRDPSEGPTASTLMPDNGNQIRTNWKVFLFGRKCMKERGTGALSVRIFSKDVQLYVYDSMFIFI